MQDQNIHETSECQNDLYAKIISNFKPFSSNDGTEFVSFVEGGHIENWPVRSQVARQRIESFFYSLGKKIPDSKVIEKIVSHLCYQARSSGEKNEIFRRVGRLEKSFFIDLGDKDWRAIQLDSEGWKVIDNPPIKFTRSSSTLQLPHPTEGGSIRPLLKYINTEKEGDLILLISYIIFSLRFSKIYPVLILQGGQGSGKSTLGEIIKRLIDPSIPTLRSVPQSEKDLFIAAQNSHLLAFDNLSGMKDWVSDALCKISTGGSYAGRSLYTNSEESVIEVSKPIIVNGIDDLCTRLDLVDRGIALHLPRISDSKRQSATEFWSDFEKEAPGIFGALLDALVLGLNKMDSIFLSEKPRMVDFARLACASMPKFGFTNEQVMDAIMGNRAEIAKDSLEMNTVGRILDRFTSLTHYWRGSPTELLDKLNEVATEQEQRLHSYPKTPQGLVRELNRIQPSLHFLGIAYEHLPRKSDKRLIQITRSPKASTQASLLSLNDDNDNSDDNFSETVGMA